nr:hypothetical transcript [Hymenolepis microstoma]
MRLVNIPISGYTGKLRPRASQMVYNVSLVHYIENAFKNPLRDAYNTVIMSAVDLRLLLVAQLYNSMRGLGTDERTLSRIICIRSEIDLPYLKSLYQQKIGKSLTDMVKSDTSGDYRYLSCTQSTHTVSCWCYIGLTHTSALLDYPQRGHEPVQSQHMWSSMQPNSEALPQLQRSIRC